MNLPWKAKNMNEDKPSKSRIIKVGYLARVEGEGSLYVKTQGEQVKDVKLKIFEPPRFFEAFLRGRSYEEASDITSRICGICPVAYQMSAVHAMENAFGMTIPHHIKQLRRLLYCGEWIESHCLHIFMLHAPDFLGYPDAIAMAKAHKKRVADGLLIKKIGNKIISLLGGREIHPINVKVGGFYKLPTKKDLSTLIDDLKWAKDAIYDAFCWVSDFYFPNLHIDYELVSLCHNQEYPINEGWIESNRNLKISINQFEQHFEEQHTSYSSALQSLRVNGNSYLTGPMARFSLNYSHLSEDVKKAAEEVGLDAQCRNPYRSIQIRALEVMYACNEALRIIYDFDEKNLSSFVETNPKASIGYAATEAPRGLLYHCYELDAKGMILSAKIVPPTSQNQKRIENDLIAIISQSLHLADHELTTLCEQTIRNYDPCISCATHFLDMKIDRS